MRLKIVFRFIGISLLMISGLMLATCLLSLKGGADASTRPLFYSMLITAVAGLCPLLFIRQSTYMTVKERYAITSGSWISVCLFGMLPFLMYGHGFTLTDALFESVSGFTTTGASILNDIEALPAGLLLWRTVTAWIGGIGIVTLFSLMIPRSHNGKSALSGAEMSDLTRSQTMMRGNGFIRSVLTVYISLTASCFILLLCTGMQWFDALTNAMSTCSTCGFCVRNASIAFYDNAAAELIIVLFMVLSGISFVGLYTAVFKKGFRQFMHSHILRTYLLILAAGTVIMSVDLTLRGGYPTYMRALRDALFQMCSITTTTGFATADTTLWPTVSTIVIIGASLICGCAGSTSGGIKVDRIVILWKRFRINVQSFIHPRWIQAVWLDGQVVKKARIANAMSFVRIYLLIVFVGAVFNAVAGLDLMTSISAAIACTGNVGPGFGLVGSFSNYASFSDPLKYGSMIMMLAGRLEITPLLFIAIDITSNRNFHYFCRRFGKNPRT